MIKLLKKFYKKAPNGKLELFGKDGMEHTVISAFVMVAVFIPSYLLLSGNWAIFSISLTYLILRLVWYWIEHEQEKAMWINDHSRPKNLWKFWLWSRARKVDIYYPFYGDTLLLGVMLWVMH